MSKPDILERLMDYGRCCDVDVDEAAEEIKRLRCEVAVLHRRVHVAQSLRLTDAEREAVEWCLEMAMLHATDCDTEVAALRGLLDRIR